MMWETERLLSKVERTELERLVRRHRTSQQMALRGHIIEEYFTIVLSRQG
jgi:hypothetical protein